MRIGFAGVANSHAFADARSARESGDDELVLWDAADPPRARRFAREFDTPAFPSLDAMLASDPELVIVTARPAQTAQIVRRVLDSGAGCFVNKLAAVDHAGIRSLGDAVAGREDRFMTASVLRFAPALASAALEVRGRRLHSVSVSVRHDIGEFLEPDRRWQDDPAQGGGTAVSLGFHAWELLSAVVGELPQLISGRSGTAARSTRSEETAVFGARLADGGAVSVDVDGRPGEEGYEIELVTDSGTSSIALGGPDPRTALGYRDCFAAARLLPRGGSAIPWLESAAVLSTTVDAARIARRERDAQAGRTTP